MILFASVGKVFAQTSLDVKSKSSSQIEKPIEISADHVEQDLAKKTIKARGRVSVRFKNRSLKADKVKINTQTGTGEASGHVFMADEGSQLHSSRATF
ncbi:MAG: LptA/OstA family protein, partial [Nitrospinales bacterium]